MSHWERQPWEKPRMECSEGPGYTHVEAKSGSMTAVAICVVVVVAIVGTWIGGIL